MTMHSLLHHSISHHHIALRLNPISNRHTNFSTTGFAGGAYGYVAMGPYRGGQAQYIRIPYADFNALILPPGTENEADFILLADIFPTGWHGVTLSGFKPGETVAVFGGGPVGLMAAYSAQLRGASRTFVVDRVPERLAAAEKVGCIPINFEEGDAVELILKANDGEMVDRSVDAVGYQAVVKGGQKEEPNIVLENMIKVTRACGGLGIPGLYVPTDPGAPDSDSAKGRISLSFGKLFEKVCDPPFLTLTRDQHTEHIHTLTFIHL
jgi:threonine dehydrogenase-like Zn-dependent dehydrogenase